MARPRVAASVTMAAVATAWGTIPLIVRTVSLPAEQLAALRLWLGAITVLVILGIRGELRLRRTDPLGRIAAIGVLLAIHWAAFFWSIKTTTVAVALVLVYLGPVAMATLARAVLGEPLKRRSIIALAAALVGVVLVARPGAGVTAEGVLTGLIAAATFAAMVLIGKPAAQQVGGLKLAGLQMSVAALVMTPWAASSLPEIPTYWWKVVLLGVVLTGVGLMIYWSLIATLPVMSIAILSYLEPASAVVWAALFLAEPGDIWSWIGVALVVGAGITAGTQSTQSGGPA
ncbi:EamA-like transporter family protein [bacterium BMS3Abin02]|nr:EamA-like transporter family protein [bacterium BMS3Abin02]